MFKNWCQRILIDFVASFYVFDVLYMNEISLNDLISKIREYNLETIEIAKKYISM